jgi:hypothetical protein
MLYINNLCPLLPCLPACSEVSSYITNELDSLVYITRQCQWLNFRDKTGVNPLVSNIWLCLSGFGGDTYHIHHRLCPIVTCMCGPHGGHVRASMADCPDSDVFTVSINGGHHPASDRRPPFLSRDVVLAF